MLSNKIGAVLRLNARAFAHADRVLNLLVAGLDGKRNDNFVDHLAHQHLLELREGADRLRLNAVGFRTPVGRVVHEADHFVAHGGRSARMSRYDASSEATGPDDEGAAHVTVARAIHGSPAGSHQ